MKLSDLEIGDSFCYAATPLEVYIVIGNQEGRRRRCLNYTSNYYEEKWCAKSVVKLNQTLPFAMRIRGFDMPISLNKEILRQSKIGVMQEFNKESNLFSSLENGTSAKGIVRSRLKKLRKIARDLDKVLSINL